MDKELLRLLQKGREHYDAREFDRAEAYLLKVAEAEKGFADVLNMLGVICHTKGQVALAQDYFEKALDINPRYTDAALNLAVTYNEQGRYAAARKLFMHITRFKTDREVQIEPYARGKLANMHADLGQAYYELQMLDRAAEQYRRALEISPDFVDLRTRLGQILRDAGDLEAAHEEFLKVKVAKPDYLPARVSLGMTFFAMGDHDIARKEWMQVLDVDPENRAANMYLKMVEQLIAQEEAEEAGVHLEVEAPLKSDRPSESEDLRFTFEGEQSSVSSALDSNGQSTDQAVGEAMVEEQAGAQDDPADQEK